MGIRAQTYAVTKLWYLIKATWGYFLSLKSSADSFRHKVLKISYESADLTTSQVPTWRSPQGPPGAKPSCGPQGASLCGVGRVGGDTFAGRASQHSLGFLLFSLTPESLNHPCLLASRGCGGKLLIIDTTDCLVRNC